MSFLSFIIYRFSTAFLAEAMNITGLGFALHAGLKVGHLE